MEAPLVLNCSKLKTSFQQQPPRLVRWGFHPSLPVPVMIGLTANGEICRIEFLRGRKKEAVLRAWKKAWHGTDFVQDQAATAALAAKVFKKTQDLKVQMTGTKFQQAVWKELQK